MTTPEYRIRPAASCGEVLDRPDTGGPYLRARPTIYGPHADWARQALSEQIVRVVQPPPFSIVLLRDVVVCPGGIVVTTNHEIIEESLIWVRQEPHFHGFRRKDDDPELYTYDHGEVGFQRGDAPRYLHVGQTYDSNYGHWLVDVVPRLVMTDRLMSVKSLCSILSSAPPEMEKVFRDTLELLDVPEQGTHTLHSSLFVSELVFPTQVTDTAWTKSPIIAPILAGLGYQLSRKSRGDRPAKLFVCRPPESRRQLLNLGELVTIAQARGYRAIDPSRMTLAEQARLFSMARKVIGVLGAELTNIAFSPCGVDLLGLAPEAMHDDFYWDLVSLKRGRYVSLHGEPREPELGMNANFNIDAEMFAQLMKAFDDLP